MTNDDSDSIEAALDRADVLEEQGKREEALELLQRLQPTNDAIVLTRIGALQSDLERWDEAEATLLQAVKVDPDLWVAHFYLALVYRAQGRLEAAEATLQDAVRINESSITLNILGVVQLELGLRQLAQESLRRAVVENPLDEEALYNLATTLDSNSRDEAVALFEKAIEIDPNYSLAHRELGWSLRQARQFPEAEYHLRRSIELSPDDGWSYIYLGNLMWEVGDSESAEASFRRAIEIWPQRGVGYWCLAHFLECHSRLKEADSLYRKAIEVDPTDAQANWRLGNYLKNIGDYERAKKYLTSAVELDPTDKRVTEALASLEK